MEEALSSLRTSVDDQDFLKLTRTVLRIIQNILNDPENSKFRTVRGGSKFVQKAGVSRLLDAVGFKLKGEDYVFECGSNPDALLEKKVCIVACRRTTGSVLGWDIPSSSLKFSLVQDKGRFGDIFIGRMDNQDVMVKIVRPGCDQEAKNAFDRELDILSKVRHPYIVQLLGVTLTSDPTSLILEHIPRCLLDVLHSTEVSDGEILKYGHQLASAMSSLHQMDILHCDLAARNLLLAADGKLRLSEFGSSCRDGAMSCLPTATSGGGQIPNVRWVPPETLRDLVFSKHSDVWSYSVVLYELLTRGSVPYATLSNTEVQSKVEGGYRLPQPQGCPEDLYHLMRLCWAPSPNDRPRFSEILRVHLEPLMTKLSSEGDARSPITCPMEEGGDHKSLHSKPSKKLKIKEPSYQSVSGKGGGLVRVYTALVSPFQRRVVVVCSRKSIVGDVVVTALAKCGKQDQDAKSHRMVLVSGPASGSPAHYLDPEDKILSVKSGAPPTAMFVLCVNMPGQAPLEIIDSIRQNPAYGSAFSLSTRGYLVCKENGLGHRNWCVLDGSTLLCYKEEEDEGVKQFESYLDFKECTVEPSNKGKSHIFKVGTSDRKHYSFLATSKDDVLQWVESISSSRSLDASPLLLHTSEGAVIQTGFMKCQEYAYDPSEVGTVNPFKPLVQRKLGVNTDLAGMHSAIDYGKHWTVLRSSGLVQCLVKGRPETLFNIAECQRVKVNNPKEMNGGVDYSIEIENEESRIVLRADHPSEHSDWVLAIEQILKKLDHERLLQGHRKRESGYVALKRLLLTGIGQPANGQRGRGSQLYCFPRVFDDMEDIYDPPKLTNPPPPKERSGHRSELLKKKVVLEDNVVPLPPKDYLPPPLPPRNDPAPPLPPRGSILQHSISTVSSESCSDLDDDYVMMQPGSSVTHSPSSTPLPTSSIPNKYVNVVKSPSQPIMIPNRRPSKRSALLRTDSESSSCAASPPPIGSSLSSLQEEMNLCANGQGHNSFSLHRQNSNVSLTSSCSSKLRHMSISSIDSATPPLPPRNNLRKKSSGFVSPAMSPSPGLTRSQSHSHRFNGSHHPPNHENSIGGIDGFSMSDGMTIAETKELTEDHYRNLTSRHHPISKAGSVSRKLVSSYVSEGYESNHSSSEDIPQFRAGWERGYDESKSRYFYFNSHTGESTWSLQEVLMLNDETRPGVGWKMARNEEGKIYYYHEQTRQTTWSLKETLS